MRPVTLPFLYAERDSMTTVTATNRFSLPWALFGGLDRI